MLLESSDAQMHMLDYQNDHDFSMQVASSDQWFPDETLMEDDAHPVIGVEVDMEPYEDDEMADDLGSREIVFSEHVDVEVFDASQAPSPDASFEHETLLLPATEPQHFIHKPSDFAEVSETIPHSAAAHDFHTFIPTELTTSLSFSSFSPRAEVAAEGNLQRHVRSHEQAATISQPDEGHRETTLDSAAFSLEEPEEHEPVEHVLVHSATGAADADATYDNTAQDDKAAAEGGRLETQNDNLGTEGDSHIEPESSRLSTGDPHEISEGVYIDPPPPVLLSFGANIPPVSLFNAPSSKAGTTGGGLETPDDSGCNSRPLVLLSHLPTLYYEPLSSVFAALRQDEHLANIPNIVHGGLLLDAYDLELVMSEDYIYAHEFSLHDLNILHDGLTKAGPLRLRLETSVPRFIHRYHMLREQITSLANDQEALPESLDDGQHEDHEDAEQFYVRAEHSIQKEGDINKEGEQAHYEEEDGQLGHAGGGLVDMSIPPQDHKSKEANQTDVESSFPDVEEEDKLDNNEDEEPHEDGVGDASTETIPTPDNSHEKNAIPDEVSGDLYQDQRKEDSATPRPNEVLPPLEDHVFHNEAPPVQGVSEEPGPSSVYFEGVNEADIPDAAVDTGELPPTYNLAGPSKDKNLLTTTVEPVDPVEFDPEAWDELDGEGDLDLAWDTEQYEQDSASTQTSSTLSSKSSTKRTLSEAELEDYQDEDLPQSASPGSKRSRME